MDKSKESIKELHITQLPMTRWNWWKHLNILYIIQLVVVPAYGLVMTLWVPLQTKTLILAVIYYFITGTGITAGYHRLWAHTSYTASTALRVYLALAAAGAVEGSIRHWSREHRAHHRYTDTEKDPYSVRKGVLYAHMGWLVMKQHPKRMGRVDISDLNNDPVVVWQHRYYIPIALCTGWILPSLIAGLGWEDWRGGFLYGGIIRTFVVNQATFCVNSLAHWLGEQPFDDTHSPRDHLVTALATLGEGYHNFHHEFPSDYRNAIEWYQYDPTKWLICFWGKLGLASELKVFKNNEIEKGRVQQLRRKADRLAKSIEWPIPPAQLPVMDWNEFQARVGNGHALIVISGIIHDLADFDHPGGRTMLNSGIGKDATAMFNGGVYNHSNAARNLLSMRRVAVVRGGGEVEILNEKLTERGSHIMI